MRLALRFAISVIVLVIVVLTIDGYVSVQRIVALYQADMKDDARVVGSLLGAVVADTWRRRGEDPAMRLIADANRGQQRMRLRWVWLDAMSPLEGPGPGP